MIKKRAKMPYKKSRRVFSATAAKVHHKNMLINPMRGGFRL